MNKQVQTSYTDAEFRQAVRDEVRQVLKEELPVMLKNNQGADGAGAPEPFMSSQQAADFLNMKVNGLYQLVHRKAIPFHKKEGLRTPVKFLKSELMAWQTEK